jgi:hypothetical protein
MLRQLWNGQRATIWNWILENAKFVDPVFHTWAI